MLGLRRSALRVLPYFLLLILGVGLVGCASSQPAASPTKTVTVTEMVTETVAAPADPEPVPEAVDTAWLEGSYASLYYPSDWNVETAEEDKGAYIDTTIRSAADPNVMVRLDVTPASGALPEDAAREVETYLIDQPGYRRIVLEPTTLNGYDAMRWEFLVRQDGVLLQKEDVFFTSDSGDSYAVLIQAPAAEYPDWLALLDEIRRSVTLAEDSAEIDPYDAGSGESDAAFCETHDCIDNFDEGRGYRVMCDDGTWSQSGGIQGACSHHGGVAGGSSDYGYSADPNDDGSSYNWCGASRDGDGDGLWCEGR
jgi:hypothetical protein